MGLSMPCGACVLSLLHIESTCAGLLLSAIRDPDPVVFFEAKMLYRTVSEDVPSGEYTIPLGEARVAQAGSDITLVGWGQQVAVLERAVSCPHAVLCSLSPLTRAWGSSPQYAPSGEHVGRSA